MQVSKQEAVHLLRRTGFAQAADVAARTLPDPVDFDQLAEFCEPYGISQDALIDRMGGSP